MGNIPYLDEKAILGGKKINFKAYVWIRQPSPQTTKYDAIYPTSIYFPGTGQLYTGTRVHASLTSKDPSVMWVYYGDSH